MSHLPGTATTGSTSPPLRRNGTGAYSSDVARTASSNRQQQQQSISSGSQRQPPSFESNRNNNNINNNNNNEDGDVDLDDDDEALDHHFDEQGMRLPEQQVLRIQAWQRVGDHEFSLDDVKLLYLLSLYSNPAGNNQDREEWIRSVPLFVLIYECITQDVLDYDYAPASVVVSHGDGSTRLVMNITQEAKSAIDFLRDAGFINGLKLSSEDFSTVTAYQISRSGLEWLQNMPEILQVPVEEAVRSTKGDLFTPFFENGQFVLRSPSGNERISSVTEPEAVSYVSSPYLPPSLRKSDKLLSTNAHRAGESAQGESTIRDVLSEALHLSNVHLIVGEWIPFGANQIVSLNERLGATDRCKGGLFTAIVDDKPTNTQFQLPTGLTKVAILDFDLVRCINFEADINYPEEEGIVQIENFGIHLNVDGTVMYGLKIESIMDRMGDDVSLDLLSRLIVDIHKDSSKIIADLLSSYQRSLLDMVFSKQKENRAKYNVILAESIDPRLPSEQYLDRGRFENELKQVVGDVLAVHDIGHDDLLIIGRDGMLYAGPNSTHHEPILLAFLSLLVKEMFIRTVFLRVFLADAKLKKTRKAIIDHDKNPNSVAIVRTWLNESSSDIILLNEVNTFLRESLELAAMPQRPEDAVGIALYEVLDVKGLHRDVMMRVTDMCKLVEGTAQELSNLSQMTDVINTKQLEDIFRNIEANTKFLVDASATHERATSSLEMIQLILAASFGFDVIDRISGGTLNVDPPWWVESWIVDPIIAKVPFLWFILNLIIGAAFAFGIFYLARKTRDRTHGLLRMRIRMDDKIDVASMEAHTAAKDPQLTESFNEPSMSVRRVAWQERDKMMWEGPPPRIEVEYDYKNSFLLAVSFDVDKRRSNISEEQLVRIFLDDLNKSEVLLDFEGVKMKHQRAFDSGDNRSGDENGEEEDGGGGGGGGAGGFSKDGGGEVGKGDKI